VKVESATSRQHAQSTATDTGPGWLPPLLQAQLAGANDTASKAADQRTNADRLASLAQSEKPNRQN